MLIGCVTGGVLATNLLCKLYFLFLELSLTGSRVCSFPGISLWCLCVVQASVGLFISTEKPFGLQPDCLPLLPSFCLQYRCQAGGGSTERTD